MTENLTTKSVEELSPTEFFERVKQSKKENQDADMTNFFECPLSELKVEGYKHNGRFNYEVAI